MIDLDTIMTTELATLGPDDNLDRARQVMHERRIHHLPVVDDNGGLVGLVTLTDVLAATDSFLRDEDSRLHPEEIPISDVMNTDVVTVDVNAGIRHAAMFMEKHKIGCLPVMDDGKLVGIITDTDFVGVAINLLEQIESSEPDEMDFDEMEFEEEEL